MYEEAAKKRHELQDAITAVSGRKMAKLEQETEEFLADLKAKTDPAVYAQAINCQPPAKPEATPNATMISVAPGSIVHSNHVKPEQMHAAALVDPALKALGGITAEQAAAFVQFSLTYMKSVSLEVAPSTDAAPSQPADLQTLNMQADAEIKRKAEDSDEYTDEELDDEEKEVE